MSDTIRVNVVEDAPVSVNVSGAVNYNNVTNKPSINGVELVGNKTSEDLHIQGGGSSDLWELIAENTDDTTPVSSYVINKDTNNNDFALKKFMLLQVAPRTDGGTNNKLYLFMNMTGGTSYSAMCPLQAGNGAIATYTRFKIIGERFSDIPTWIINTTNTDYSYVGGTYAGGIYNTKFGYPQHDDINKIATSFILSANARTTATTDTVAVKWQLWGVRV